MIKISGYKEIKGILVFSDGRIFNRTTGKFLKQTMNGGYYSVILNNGKEKRKEQVHRVVAKCFIENTHNKSIVNHIDGNKLNNNVDNLEWATHSENIKHAHNNGLIKSRLMRRLTPDKVLEIYNSKDTLINIRDKYDVSIQVISEIKNLKRKYYKQVIEGH